MNELGSGALRMEGNRMRGWIAVLFACCCSAAAPTSAAGSGGWGVEKRTAIDWIDHNRARAVEVNQSIWEAAELGLQEVESSKSLRTWLKQHGFEVTSGVADMPTAFVASYGSGRPVIAILAEYDALPGLSQEAVSERRPRVEGGAGHGCGHSLFGTGSTAAAIAISEAMREHGLQGTVRLYGTPAEETLIGKIYMVKAGLFDDVDVVLRWHPLDLTRSAFDTTLAMVSVKFLFTGVSAHAAAAPHKAHSALDAVELMDTGVNFMREHIKDDARIHYVITDGGGQPNVVPARAEVWYYIRAYAHQDVEAYFEWIVDIAKAAAQMTRTEVAVRVETDTHEVIPNRPLAELVDANLHLVGPPPFDRDDTRFARELQQSFSGARAADYARALATDIQPLPEEPARVSASTDVGDISWKVPSGGLSVASYPSELPMHSWAVVASGGAPVGRKAMLVAAKTLAATGIDLLLQPKLIEAARADLEARVSGKSFHSLIPPEQRAPQAIR